MASHQPDDGLGKVDIASGNIEGRDQGLSAMATVLELTPLDLAQGTGGSNFRVCERQGRAGS